MSSHLHRNNGSKIIRQVEISNVDVFDIFPSTIFSGNLNVDNNEILNECYVMKTVDPEGNSRSNLKGWQSKLQSIEDLQCWNEWPVISDLAAKSVQFVNEILFELKYDVEFREDSCCWWVNINNKFAYNVMHSHPKSDIVGVYYPKIDSENQGQITFVRTDGSLHTELYSSCDDLCFYKMTVEQGRIYFFPAHLLHYVTPNETDSERISISFNLTL
jgi:uncharacterized protein (TIGR02466 family)